MQNNIQQALVGLETSDTAHFLRNIARKLCKATNGEHFYFRGRREVKTKKR